MAQLDKNDLAQMNEDYFKSLKKERLVEVAKNLHILATDLWEKQQQNSENSDIPSHSKTEIDQRKFNWVLFFKEISMIFIILTI